MVCFRRPQKQEKTSGISSPVPPCLESKNWVFSIIFWFRQLVASETDRESFLFPLGGWQRIDRQVMSNIKIGSWKTFKQVSASLLQIKKKQQTQSNKNHIQTSPHHPSPKQFKCTQSAKQVVVYSETRSSSNIHVQK